MPRFTLSPRGLLDCLITACLTQSVYAVDKPANASVVTTHNAAVLQTCVEWTAIFASRLAHRGFLVGATSVSHEGISDI